MKPTKEKTGTIEVGVSTTNGVKVEFHKPVESINISPVDALKLAAALTMTAREAASCDFENGNHEPMEACLQHFRDAQEIYKEFQNETH